MECAKRSNYAKRKTSGNIHCNKEAVLSRTKIALHHQQLTKQKLAFDALFNAMEVPFGTLTKTFF